MKRLFLLFIGLFLLAFAVAQAQDDPVLSVDVAVDEGAISPYVYGANYGPPSFVPLDMVEEAQASGVTYYRIPAGAWGDSNDLTPQYIDLYYGQAQQWGAELAISARSMGGGGTPEKAADLVRYTMEKGYNVRYWAIGNEPNLLDAYQGDDPTNFSHMQIDQYNSEWRQVAEAMLAVNPDIILIGPDVSQYSSTVEGDSYTEPLRQWVRAFLQANGDLVDIVAVHRYPFPINHEVTTLDQLRNDAASWDVLVDHLRDDVLAGAGREIPIAITEANSHWSNSGNGPATPDSHFNAIWWGDVLGRLITKKVEIVSYFSFQSAGSIGEFGLIERYKVRPTYYTYQLYKQFGTQLVHSESTEQYVRIYAALREDGNLTLMVINMGDEEVTRKLQLSNFSIAGNAEAYRLDKEHNADQIESQPILDGVSVTLPPQSITLYVVPSAATSKASETVAFADGWPRQYYAPYVYMGGYPSYFLAQVQAAEGINYFTLGFVLNGVDQCRATWAGSAPVEMNNFLKTDLEKLQAAGGDVIISFGGAGGDELAMTCPDVESLQAAYQGVVDLYHVTHLDFDIEGNEIGDAVSIERRSQALAAMQAQAIEAGQPLSISFTLPVEPTGLTEDGLAVLQSAVDNGVDVSVVNIMTMNFGEAFPIDQMGQNTIDAATSLHDQLKVLYPDRDDATLWGMIGVTPMIGVNDRSTQVFTVDDAQSVVDFAQENGMRLISMWALDRDESCVSNVAVAANNCSGVVQSPMDFSAIFNAFTTTE